MNDFSHVSDDGVRKYLEEGSDDLSVVAAQLDVALRCLTADYQDEHIYFETLEQREAAYDEACEYFGWRNLEGVHEALKAFWRA
jgi:hypothetical protein